MAAQGNWFLGTPNRFENVPQYDPAQFQAILGQLQQGQQTINNPYEGFNDIQNDVMRHFKQEIIPGLNTQFAKSGNNNPNSPIHQQNIYGAGQDLATRLASLRSQYGMANKNFGLRQIDVGLRKPFETTLLGGEPGALKEFGGPVLETLLKNSPDIAKALSGYFGKGGGNDTNTGNKTTNTTTQGVDSSSSVGDVAGNVVNAGTTAASIIPWLKSLLGGGSAAGTAATGAGTGATAAGTAAGTALKTAGTVGTAAAAGSAALPVLALLAALGGGYGAYRYIRNQG